MPSWCLGLRAVAVLFVLEAVQIGMLIAGTPTARPAPAAPCRHLFADSISASSYNFPQVCSGDLAGLQPASHSILQRPTLDAVSR